MVHLKHFGVYGICIREGKLLCVRKNRGPYTGDMIYQEEAKIVERVYWIL